MVELEFLMVCVNKEVFSDSAVAEVGVLILCHSVRLVTDKCCDSFALKPMTVWGGRGSGTIDSTVALALLCGGDEHAKEVSTALCNALTMSGSDEHCVIGFSV